ncbi:MAG: cell cycle transcriptional regulator TrcR [Pseudomonadota bacterium]|nr:cell cycle transcriptional regulator TrcR [Pseudomonadota bacterium]
MSRVPLMPKATAVWLVENTPLSFEQIAEFCGLHVLEVKGIADGDVAQGIKGMDPISSGQLSREEIARATEDASYRLKISEPKTQIPVVKSKKGPRYTPVSRRQDRPNAVQWLLRHHPELKESQIMRLVGTTKPTIQAIRERTHWNAANLQPADPVTLGLCTQIDLDREVRRASKRVERERKEAEKAAIKAGTLLPTEVTTAPAAAPKHAQLVTAAEHAARKAAAEEAALLIRGLGKPEARPEKSEKQEKARRLEEALSEAESVFGKLKPMKRDAE